MHEYILVSILRITPTSCTCNYSRFTLRKKNNNAKRPSRLCNRLQSISGFNFAFRVEAACPDITLICLDVPVGVPLHLSTHGVEWDECDYREFYSQIFKLYGKKHFRLITVGLQRNLRFSQVINFYLLFVFTC